MVVAFVCVTILTVLLIQFGQKAHVYSCALVINEVSSFPKLRVQVFVHSVLIMFHLY